MEFAAATLSLDAWHNRHEVNRFGNGTTESGNGASRNENPSRQG
jgi:hypothetical protein